MLSVSHPEACLSTAFTKAGHRLKASGAVTTGGNVYSDGAEEPTNSPTDGRKGLFVVFTVGTDLALSALRRSEGGTFGDDALLLRRSLVWTGETACACGTDI